MAITPLERSIATNGKRINALLTDFHEEMPDVKHVAIYKSDGTLLAYLPTESGQRNTMEAYYESLGKHFAAALSGHRAMLAHKPARRAKAEFGQPQFTRIDTDGKMIRAIYFAPIDDGCNLYVLVSWPNAEGVIPDNLLRAELDDLTHKLSALLGLSAFVQRAG